MFGPDNPYHVEGAVPADGIFVGRGDGITWIWAGLNAGERILLIEGRPLIGKSSLLLHAAQEAAFPFFGFYVDAVRDIPGDTAEWLATLEAAIRSRLLEAVGLDAGDLSAAMPEESGRALRDVGSTVRIVLFLDHLDQLLRENAPAGRALLRTLADWMGRDGRAGLVLSARTAAALRQLDELPLARAPAHRLEPLSRTETYQLIRVPAEGVLEYEYESLERIDELCGRQPYFVQLLCGQIFEMKRGAERVFLADVEPAAVAIGEMDIPLFHEMWEAAGREGKILLSLIGEMKGAYDVVTPAELATRLRAHAIEPDVQDILAALFQLQESGAMEGLGAQSFRPFVEVFRYWLRAQHPTRDTLRRFRWVPRRTIAPPEPPAEKNTKPPERSWAPAMYISLIVLVIAFGLIAMYVHSAAPPPETPTPTPGLATLAAMVVNPNGTSSPVAPSVSGTGTPRPTLIPTLTPTATRPAVLVRPLPAIAFMRMSAEGKWKIWVMGADGSDASPLTSGIYDDTSPVWSPDGERLLFVSDRDGNKEIYLMRVDGSGLVNLTQNPADDWTPAWSPDGTEIAFSSMRDGNWEIYLMWSDGTFPLRLTDAPESDIAPAWSPDGRHIAFASERGGNWDIYVMDRDGQNLQQLTTAPASDVSPAWSPDGKYIAFESFRDGNAEIYLMRANGTEQQNISRMPNANDHWPTWSPDGERIAFYSNRSGTWDIYVMRVDGTDVQNLTNGEGNNQAPSWRP